MRKVRLLAMREIKDSPGAIDILRADQCVNLVRRKPDGNIASVSRDPATEETNLRGDPLISLQLLRL
ncbi:hypothetical protein RB195_012322 [Necator americanus]|uniref:Uncharacterized protein n=1 Tax=Necator americanus TaxID=51031 RepID=A0ABR1D6M7_NECAM